MAVATTKPDTITVDRRALARAITLADLAQAEFSIWYEAMLDLVTTRRKTQAQAEAMLAPWAALARYYGADLPASLCAADGSQLHWIDFYPATMRADAAMTKMATEVRRACITLLTRHAGDTTNQPTTNRARALRHIDDHLSVMANLGPIDLTVAAERAAA